MTSIERIRMLRNWQVNLIEQTVPALVIRGMDCRHRNGFFVRCLWGLVFLLAGSGAFAQLSQDTENRQGIEEAQAVTARVRPVKPRRLLIYTPSEYDGHNAAIAYANEAFAQMGEKTGAFEVTVTDDPSFFERPSLSRFDAVFLNNTIGKTLSESRLRQNLLEFVTGGGGLMGVHGTVIAFTKNLWPAVEDWPEFGYVIGARGYAHRHGLTEEPVTIAIDDPSHPLTSVFDGQGFSRADEIFRFSEPYSRERVRVLLSLDVAKTDLSAYPPGDPCLRADNDYAVAWVRNYGKGRVFYSSLAHSPKSFNDPRLLQFYFDAAQFVLGDLEVPTTPSAKLSPAVRAQEKLGWRLGMEAYTFHKFTFFETIEKTAELGLCYVGGLSFQDVSKEIKAKFDPSLTDEQLRQIRMKLEEAGVRLVTHYVQYFPEDEAGCRRLFEFGRKMGIETFMGEPKPQSLELVDRFCNEYGINVTIHNHDKNISPVYWDPHNVLKACQGRSPRIGACGDMGYWMRMGIDPIEAVRLLKDRLTVVHMHDLHASGPGGHNVPWGTGVGKSEEFFGELHRLGLKPMIGLEYSYNFTNNMPEVAQCIAFFNATTLKLAGASQPKPQGY